MRINPSNPDFNILRQIDADKNGEITSKEVRKFAGKGNDISALESKIKGCRKDLKDMLTRLYKSSGGSEKINDKSGNELDDLKKILSTGNAEERSQAVLELEQLARSDKKNKGPRVASILAAHLGSEIDPSIKDYIINILDTIVSADNNVLSSLANALIKSDNQTREKILSLSIKLLNSNYNNTTDQGRKNVIKTLNLFLANEAPPNSIWPVNPKPGEISRYSGTVKGLISNYMGMLTDPKGLAEK